MTRPGKPSLADRWTAAQRLRLARTRPATPGGDVRGEARLYADVAGPPVARTTLSTRVGHPDELALRTKVVDAEVARAVGGGADQIVLLGPGYDGRPLRFAGGSTRWFDVDRPETLADTRRRLATLGLTPSPVSYVGIDLRQGGAPTVAALETAGHESGVPSLFVCETSLTRLTLETTAALCGALRSRAPAGSRLVATFFVAPEAQGASAQTLRRATGALSELTGPGRDQLRPGDPEKLMVVTGWHVIHSETSGGRFLERGSRQQVLVCTPDPATPP
jgi:methyltransferase (TIGR00027 family)